MSKLYINGEWYSTGTWESCNEIVTRRSQDPECQDEVYEIVTEKE